MDAVAGRSVFCVRARCRFDDCAVAAIPTPLGNLPLSPKSHMALMCANPAV